MGDSYGPAVLSLSQTVGAFQFFLPPLSVVRKASPMDADMIGDVRLGEIGAVALCVGTGAIAASFAKSSIPLVVGLATATILILVYEAALRGYKLGNPIGNEEGANNGHFESAAT